MQACIERLVKVSDQWNPELGTFGTFATTVIDSAIKDFMRDRLALNGYKYPVTHEALAAELGMSERHIRRIEGVAVQKLQRAVL